MNKFVYLILIVAFLGMPLCAQGQDNTAADAGDAGIQAGQDQNAAVEEQVEQEETEIEEVPAIQRYDMTPEIYTWLGARVVSVDGSKRSIQYGWPFSGVAGGFKLHYSPLPHKLDAELEWLNLYDNQAEFSYAYKDVFKLNYVGVGLWHNLPHYMPTSSSVPAAVLDRNPKAGYQVDVRNDRVSLRFKLPERPYHIFTDFREFIKEGTIQQRFYGVINGGTRNGKITESRDIEWITRNYVMGVNGHFGPLEAEYSHRIKTFNPHGDVTLTDRFNVSISSVNHPYNASHNVVPEFENNYDTLKVHTSLTGRIVGALTLTTGSKDNERSGSHADFNRAFADMTFIPFEKATVAVRYRYSDLQVDNPRIVVDPNFPAGFGVPPTSIFRATKDSMDRRTNRAEVVMRYVPVPRLAFRLEYDFANVKRQNATAWSEELAFQTLPSVQNIHTVKVGADTRPFKTLSLKANASYVYTSDPAYPAMPQSQFSGKLDASWTPVNNVSAAAYYRLVRESNNTSDMRGYKDNAGALVSWSPMDRLSVYGNYDYSRYHRINEVGLNMLLSTGPAVYGVRDDSVPYTDTAHVYSLGMGYNFSFPLALNTEFHQSWSKGKFRTDLQTAAISSSYIGPLTDLNVRETGGSVNAKYDFSKGWGTSATYAINDYQILDRPQDGPQDGTAHTVMLIVSKKW